MRRVIITKTILTVLAGIGVAATIVRFGTGLGAATGLSDSVPWGFWVGFEVMAGVALAAGGFVITATVHIFKIERFKPFLRPTILTAFLGYFLVPLGLIVDLGLPWNLWHPMVYWQEHSVLFEVALCVMIYLTVLAIEFAPAVLEHPFFGHSLFQSLYRFLKRFTIVFVIMGIILSTLHQSSLGSLFLIMPHRVHPLWYSPIIFVLYYISAIGLGCSMIIFESTVTSLLYGHKPEKKLVQSLGRASSIVILLYATVRCIDLALRHKLSLALNGTWQSNLFLAEMTISVILPLLLFNVRQLRSKTRWLFLGSLLVVLGFILNRLCLSFITAAKPEGGTYFPTLIELFTSIGLVSGAALIFLYCVEHLNLFEGKFLFKPVRNVRVSFFSRPGLEGQLHSVHIFSIYTMFFILSISLGVAFFYANSTPDRKYHPVPVMKAQAMPDAKTLRIRSGNDLDFIDFNHQAHQDTLGKKESCVKCHHMSVKKETVTPCYVCHSDMYREASIFNHGKHETKYRDKGSCGVCHPRERTALTFRPCKDCHPAMFPEKLAAEPLNFTAPAYMDAMHKSCIPCHLQEWPKRNKPTPDYCNTCHKNRGSDIWTQKYVIGPQMRIRDSLAAIDSLARLDSLAALVAIPKHAGHGVPQIQKSKRGVR